MGFLCVGGIQVGGREEKFFFNVEQKEKYILLDLPNLYFLISLRSKKYCAVPGKKVVCFAAKSWNRGKKRCCQQTL